MRTATGKNRLTLLGPAAMVIAVALTACASTMMPAPPQAGADPRTAPGSAGAPVIEDSFAVSSMPNGALWNVYLQASDPAGDMSHLWVVVRQLGKKEVTETIPLTGPNQKAFSGFVTVYPRGAVFSQWENLDITVRIRDRAGNLSGRVEHQVQMGWQTREMPPAKWASATHNQLGTILIDLESDNDPLGIRGR